MDSIEAYISEIFETHSPDKEMVKACELAIEANSLPQQSKVHSVEVAKLLSKLKLDKDTLIATLISDPNLEPFYPSEKLLPIFGRNIVKLLEGIRALNHFKDFHPNTTSNEVQTERLRQMLLAMTSDIRIMIVKLAYRVAKLRTLKYEPEEVRIHIAKETQLIFAPLANRLGISQLKWEMEDLSFRFLHPETYKSIANQLDSKRVERETYIENFLDELKTMFVGKNYHISGRPKHIYSIWKKMSNKALTIDELYDLRAVRIYVENLQQCYEVLGAIHSRWNYVKKEFDDYIASPKENGYQSIHTVIYGPEGKTVEIQVRTHSMHHHAEYGVAAHWKYKEGDAVLDQSLEKSISLVRQMLEYNDNPDLLNEISTELLSEHIYVMSPKKEIITLRKGYTPLDFAYQIHTELGHRCRGAKVNGRIVPLTYQLKTSDEIEILTVKGGTPSRNWLNPNLGYLASGRSRAKVRQWFNHLNKEANIESGEALFHRETKRLHARHLDDAALFHKLGFDKPLEFYEALGKGKITESQLASTIQKTLLELKGDAKALVKKPPFGIKRIDEIQPTAYVVGAPQLKTSLAPCCAPKPGDDIVGFVTRGRGVTIHHSECANILNLSHEDQKRIINVAWTKTDGLEDHSDQIITAEIELLAFDRKGLLRDIMTYFMLQDINLTESNTITDKKERTVSMKLEVELNQSVNLSQLLDKLETIENIESASIRTT